MDVRIVVSARLFAALLLIAFVLLGCRPVPPTPPEPEDGTRIAIISPVAGSVVAGPTYFAVQLLGPSGLRDVRFKAGGTELVPTHPGENGTRVFLLPQDYSDGPLELVATVEDLNGKLFRSTVVVTIVSDPPSEATVTAAGAVLGALEANGATSVLTIPPGSAPGTRVTFEAMTQDEIRLRTGVDYEALGLTFLGAQDFTSDAPINTAVGVSSGGFGPRVQPGQAVVNYAILPDADGDGVGEVVVINNAVVAPNGDVITEPVPAVMTGAEAVVSGATGLRTYAATDVVVQPGSVMEVPVAGMNVHSQSSNVAVFVSDSNGVFGTSRVLLRPGVDGSQVARVVVPNMPPGSANVVFINISLGTVSERLAVSVLPPSALTRPIENVYSDYFDRLITALGEFPASQRTAVAVRELQAMRTTIGDLVAGASPDVLKQLEVGAQMLEQALSFADSAFFLSPSADGFPWRTAAEYAEFVLSAGALVVGGTVGGVAVGTILGGAALGISVSLIAYDLYHTKFDPVGGTHTIVSAPFEVAHWVADPVGKVILGKWTKGLGVVGVVISWAGLSQTLSDNLGPPMPPAGSPGSPVGMGGAPPQGSPGAGNIIAPASLPGPALNAAAEDPITERFSIKLLSGGAFLAFSAAIDATGYFYIPGLPDSQPFTLIARDNLTGEVRTVDGVGRPPGGAVMMVFDFTDDSGTPPVQSTSLNSMVSGTVQAGGSRLFSFDAEAGQLVRFGLFTEVVNPGGFTGVGLSVFDPDGEVLATTGSIAQYQHFHRTFERTVQVSGTYMMAIGNALEEDVTFTAGLVEIGDPVIVTPGAQGLDISDSIDVLHSLNRVAFDAPEGGGVAKVTLAVPSDSDLMASVLLRSPSERRYSVGNAGGAWGDIDEVVALIEDGRYVLEVEGGDTSTLGSFTGSYDARLFVAPPLVTPQSQGVPGQLGPDQVALHDVKGEATGTFAVLVNRQSGGQSEAEVSLLHGGLQTVPLTGDSPLLYGYFYARDFGPLQGLVVNNLRDVDLDYEVAIHPMPDALELGPDRPLLSASGSLDVLGQIRRYSFSGSAGEQLTVTLGHPADERLNARLTVGRLGEDGRLQQRQLSLSTYDGRRSHSGSLTLPEDGEYVIDVNLTGDEWGSRAFDSLDQLLGTFDFEVVFE